MLLRAVAIWLGILVLASLNGALRDLVMAPRLGDTLARALSTLLLCGLVLLVTWYTVAWIGPRTTRDALTVGTLGCAHARVRAAGGSLSVPQAVAGAAGRL